MGLNGLVFILVVGACRAVGWEKLGRWYGDLLVTYLIHKGESQVASPVFQCGPPKVVPQQISNAGVVTGVSLITDDVCGAAVHSLKLGLVLIEVWVPDGWAIIRSGPDQGKIPGGYSSSSRAGRLGRTLWSQNSTYVAETEKGGQNSTMTPPTLEKGVNSLHQYEKSEKKGVKNLQL